MTDASVAARLFALRGWFMAGVAAAALLLGEGSIHPEGAPWIAAGLALRGWAFAWLGPTGRTRDPAPPATRVGGGPYALLHHPVYVANVVLAGGFGLALRPPGPTTAALLVAVVALYTLLAAREERQLAVIGPAAARPRLGLAAVVRSERSTWATTAAVLLLAAVR